MSAKVCWKSVTHESSLDQLGAFVGAHVGAAGWFPARRIDRPRSVRRAAGLSRLEGQGGLCHGVVPVAIQHYGSGDQPDPAAEQVPGLFVVRSLVRSPELAELAEDADAGVLTLIADAVAGRYSAGAHQPLDERQHLPEEVFDGVRRARLGPPHQIAKTVRLHAANYKDTNWRPARRNSGDEARAVVARSGDRATTTVAGALFMLRYLPDPKNRPKLV
jgi:hypothetical protein